MISEFYSKPFPVIDIKPGFRLREQVKEDAEAFFNYYSNPAVSRHILVSAPKSIAEAEAEIHYCRCLFYERKGAYWTLEDTKKKEMIGGVGLYINNQHYRAEICYELSQDYWRTGLMTDTLKKVIGFTFNSIGLHRVEALTTPDNIASINLLKKLGFEEDGILKNYRYHEGSPRTVKLFSMVPEQFR